MIIRPVSEYPVHQEKRVNEVDKNDGIPDIVKNTQCTSCGGPLLHETGFPDAGNRDKGNPY